MYDGLIDELRNSKPNRRLAWQAADAIEELENRLAFSDQNAKAFLHTAHKLLDEQPKWISVEERLPENCDNRFLVCTRRMTGGLWQSICYYANNLHEVDEYDFPNKNRPGFYFYDSEYGWIEKEDVTHWMPLPEPPKEET